MEFSILMPCLNEGASLAFCINEAKSCIDRLNLEAEIIVADNGSDDGSPDIAEENGARVVRITEKGYGAALMGGIKAARGRYVIMGDADGSYDFSRLEPFVDALRNGADLVVGDRFLGGIEKGAMPTLHRLGVPVLSALGRWKFRTDVKDFHCGIRGFNREKALSLGLKCCGMEFATEIIAAFAMSGSKISQVPAALRKDLRSGKSHLRPFRDGWRHLKFILFSQK